MDPEKHEQDVTPAIAGILREIDKMIDALRVLGYEYTKPSAPPPVQEGVYPLMEVSKIPDLHVVEDEPESPAEQVAKQEDKAILQEVDPGIGDAKRQAKLSDVAEPVQVDTTVPPVGTNVPPVDPTERADGQEAWRKSHDDAKRVLVALNTLKRAKIPSITTSVNATGASISEATIRRVLYGRAAQKPDNGTLMQRGLVSQANPYARGKIVYRLTPLGEQAVAFGASLAKPTS